MGKNIDFISAGSVCEVSVFLNLDNQISPKMSQLVIKKFTSLLWTMSVVSTSIRLIIENSGTLLVTILGLTSQKVKRSVKHVSIRNVGI